MIVTEVVAMIILSNGPVLGMKARKRIYVNSYIEFKTVHSAGNRIRMNIIMMSQVPHEALPNAQSDEEGVLKYLLYDRHSQAQGCALTTTT